MQEGERSQQKLFEEAYFILNLTSPAMVRPASSEKWKAPFVTLGKK